MKRTFPLLLTGMLVGLASFAQLNTQSKTYTLKDTLRGTLGEERNWWDVQHYAIYVEPDYANKTIKGKVDIRFKVKSSGKVMQIDLQEPMELEKAYLGDHALPYSRKGNAFL